MNEWSVFYWISMNKIDMTNETNDYWMVAIVESSVLVTVASSLFWKFILKQFCKKKKKIGDLTQSWQTIKLKNILLQRPSI